MSVVAYHNFPEQRVGYRGVLGNYGIGVVAVGDCLLAVFFIATLCIIQYTLDEYMNRLTPGLFCVHVFDGLGQGCGATAVSRIWLSIKCPPLRPYSLKVLKSRCTDRKIMLVSSGDLYYLNLASNPVFVSGLQHSYLQNTP